VERNKSLETTDTINEERKEEGGKYRSMRWEVEQYRQRKWEGRMSASLVRFSNCDDH
jgi:hypothetical protein